MSRRNIADLCKLLSHFLQQGAPWKPRPASEKCDEMKHCIPIIRRHFQGLVKTVHIKKIITISTELQSGARTLSDPSRKDGRMRGLPQFGCHHVLLLFMRYFLTFVRNLAPCVMFGPCWSRFPMRIRTNRDQILAQSTLTRRKTSLLRWCSLSERTDALPIFPRWQLLTTNDTPARATSVSLSTTGGVWGNCPCPATVRTWSSSRAD